MTEILSTLTRDLWQGSLTDRSAPEATVCAAMRDQGMYWDIRHALWRLGQAELPGAKAAEMACSLWVGSIDMAFHAVILGHDKPAALARLEDWITKKNIKRATLANAYVQLEMPDQALESLRKLDPDSATYSKDLIRRIELALWLNDFRTAAQDISALAGSAKAAALGLRLTYSQEGAAAVRSIMDQTEYAPAEFWAQLFEIFIGEGDFEHAPRALEHWHACPDHDAGALARAKSRLLLERGDGALVLNTLMARLDPSQPWRWSAQDHVQLLRAKLLTMEDTPALHAHAQAACRVHPRHDWLSHLALTCAEGYQDWRDLVPKTSRGNSHALVAAGAATRLGRHALALGLTSALRRSKSASHLPQRARLLRAANFMHAGRIRAARKALETIDTGIRNAGAQLDRDLLAVELALLDRDTQKARSILTRLQTRSPRHKAVLLAKARCAFFEGDFAAAQTAHEDFNHLKAIETGQSRPPDLRDRIVTDALHQMAKHKIAAPDILTELTPAQIVASPALSAWALARRGPPVFQPVANVTIPKRIGHYWEGAASPALLYTQQRWAQLHPSFEQIIFDKESAADWLLSNFGPEIRTVFLDLPLPAFRADLFRLAWILRQGGIFADLDEYPRKPVTAWLDGANGVFCIEKGFGSVANNFLAGTPGHMVFETALNHTLTALNSTSSPYAWWHCGPAQMTRAVYEFCFSGAPPQGARLLSQSEYCSYIATNLPFPHKRSQSHWR